MLGYRNRRVIKNSIVRYMRNVTITVLVTMTVAFTLSLLFSTSYRIILKYSALAISLIGALSVIGSWSPVNRFSNLSISSIENASDKMINSIKKDLELLYDSYSFLIFMATSAGILFAIYLLI